VVKLLSLLHPLLPKIGLTITHLHPLNHLKSTIKETPMILHHLLIKKEEISISIDQSGSVKTVFM
jgi:hypothetical protein